jgi:hypothetical protein
MEVTTDQTNSYTQQKIIAELYKKAQKLMQSTAAEHTLKKTKAFLKFIFTGIICISKLGWYCSHQYSLKPWKETDFNPFLDSFASTTPM